MAGELLERPDLVADDRYRRNEDRVRLRAELDEIIGAWCAERDLADIRELADDAGIGNARLNNVKDLAEHAQLSQRNRWRNAQSPVGAVPALLHPALARHWQVVQGKVPALGEDTEALRAEAGLLASRGSAAQSTDPAHVTKAN